MTAPSRIPHGEAVRNAVRVEWMRLETVADLRMAVLWMHSHGLWARWDDDGTSARVWGQRGPSLLAELGQVLAYNPTSGEFTVWDANRFDEAHSEVEA